MLKKYKNKTLIIAEAGINHNGDIKEALKLIKFAKKSGADAVKFQTYITEKRTKKNSPIFDVLKKCELSFKNFHEMKLYAEDQGIDFISTPFDKESTSFLLKELKLPVIKIASFYSNNIEMFNYINNFKTDIILSLGMTKLNSVTPIIKKISKKNTLALLHCVSSYPNLDEDANLAVIQNLKNKFNNIIGYSDHTIGIDIPSLAVASGAQIIEKHFMINKNDKVVDKAVSIDSIKFKKMVEKIRQTEKIMGKNNINIRKVEKKFLFLKNNKLR